MRLLTGLAFVAAVSFACASSARSPGVTATAQPSSTPAPAITPRSAAAPIVTSTPMPMPSADLPPVDRGAPGGGGGKLFSRLFGSAIGAAADGDVQPGPGDETLKQYLLRSDDLPTDFHATIQTLVGSFPDGISARGMVDVAASLAFNGGRASDSPEGSVVSIVVAIARFNALAETASLLDPARRTTDTEFRAAITSELASADDGEFLQEFSRLDSSQVGQDAVGVEWSVLNCYDYDEEASRCNDSGNDLIETYTFYVIPLKNYVETIYAVAYSSPGAPPPTSPDLGQLSTLLRARLMTAP